MRKLNLLLLLILIVAFSTTIFAQKMAIIKPTTPGVKSEAIPIDKNMYKKLMKNEVSNKTIETLFESSHMGIIDSIYHSDAYESNWGTIVGDTNVSYYEPPAACYIKAIGITGQTWGTSPLATGFNLLIHKAAHPWVWDPAKFVGAGDQAGLYTRDSLGYATLLGEEMWGFGGFPVSIVDGEKVWTEMILLENEPDTEGEGFIVATVPYGDAGAYMGTRCWYPGETNTNDVYRLAKFYQAGRSGYDPQWVVRHFSLSWWIVVEYYENTGPKIEGIPQLASTYFSSEPAEISATITDIDASNTANAGVKDAYLMWMANGATDSVAMSSSGDLFTATLPSVSGVGKVMYWVSATDKGSPSLRSTSTKYSFDIVEPTNPNADVLLVLQDPHNSDFYRNALSNLGFVYEEWNADANYGIDASVTGYGWSTILLAGCAANTIPTRGYEGNPYAAFLNGGGNLFLSDMDYFYGNAEPADPIFEAGDFAYDFFGLAGGTNDPGAHLDSLINGVANDTISGNWAETPLNLSWYRYWTDLGNTGVDNNWNWIDYITVGNSTKILTAESGNDVGVRYEGSNFKTVYLSFMADAMGDSVASPDFDNLIQNVLTWFRTKPIVSVETRDNTPVVNTYSLKQNYPNPFNPVTRIEYTIPEESQVNIAIYNVLGKKVAELVNKHQKAGKYDIIWNAKDAANGVYFCKMKAGDYTKTMKMLLLR